MDFGIALEVEASCAICGAPPFPECPHEGQRLEVALNQAQDRWNGMQAIRNWVLEHARNQVISTFHQLRTARYAQHVEQLQTLPCFTLYQRWQGNPPINPSQLHMLQSQIHQANANYKAGVDEDWRRSCLRYPEVLDYYFGMVSLQLPSEDDPAIMDPRFGAPLKEARRSLKARKESMLLEEDEESFDRGHRRKNKRRSRDWTPPAAPMPGSFRR
ncbi:hypothetical protein Tdes44962_MAKER03857 [Teratosphaeria destructans]|uniref:Uncharacterized protein n=1 Tax=Teratosphaeria destructans TaxID=418781 RepID=A0A9W7SNS6_9PEZI|nr:hypothetical protein Tdes44962_MAKER03857 [Teratosphaeria destructans]